MPAPNYFGADSFTYTANDGSLSSGVVTVSIEVTAVNDVPLARPDTLTVRKNGSATVDALANDTDVEGDTLTVVAFTQGRHGERQVQRREPQLPIHPGQGLPRNGHVRLHDQRRPRRHRHGDRDRRDREEVDPISAGRAA